MVEPAGAFPVIVFVLSGSSFEIVFAYSAVVGALWKTTSKSAVVAQGRAPEGEGDGWHSPRPARVGVATISVAFFR